METIPKKNKQTKMKTTNKQTTNTFKLFITLFITLLFTTLPVAFAVSVNPESISVVVTE